jgi:adenine deaminase
MNESSHEITQDLAAVAMGRQPADLIIRGGRLVNVNVGRIQDNVDVVVRHGWIALVGNSDHVLRDEHTRVVEAGGRFLVPGFIDSHMHVESTMVTSAVCRRCSPGIHDLPDNHEITNVFGLGQ